MNTYALKKYQGEGSNYIEFENYIEKSISPIESFNLYLYDRNINIPSERILKLPQTSFNHLIELLKEFNLESYENEFLTLITITQKEYLKVDSKIEDEIPKDFLTYNNDLVSLIQITKDYFTDKNDLSIVSFKFNKEGTKSVKNSFLTSNIFNLIIEEYNIDVSNFDKEIASLKKNKTFKFNKGQEYVKSQITKSLFSFLRNKKPDWSEARLLEFCGLFLHICQIPSNNSCTEIDIEDIKNSLKLIETQNMRHYLHPRTQFYK